MIRDNIPTFDEASPRTRIAYLDTLRAATVAMVIVHHAAMPYADAAAWLVTNPQHAPILGRFLGINAAFGMSLFFLIAGYLVPASYDRHGAAGLVKDRLRRLGVPLVVFSLIMIAPGLVFDYLRAGGPPLGLPAHVAATLFGPVHLGHLWFLADLLCFVVVYALWRAAVPHRPARATEPPGAVATLAFLALVTAATFAARIVFPVDRWVAVMWIVPVEPAHLPQYIAWFVVGALAARRGWLHSVSALRGRAYLALGVGTVILAYAVLLWRSGGATWAALLWSACEAMISTGLCAGLIVLFRDHFSSPGRLARAVAPLAYATYIFHIPVVLAVQIALASLAWPPVAKFGVAASLAVPLSFLAAAGLRKVPVLRALL